MLIRIAHMARLVGLGTSFCLLICCASLNGNLRPRWEVLSQKKIGYPPLINSIIFFDDLNGLALNPLSLASTADGGTHWTERLDSGNRGFYSMRFVDGRRGWIIGVERRDTQNDSAITPNSLKPMILRTEDGGVKWRQINLDQFLGSSGSRFSKFSSMCIAPSGVAWIVGDAGIVEATFESDSLLASHVTPTRAELNDVSCLDSGEVWAAGAHGLVLRYQQKTWAPIPYPDGDAFFARVKVAGNTVWLIGRTGAKNKDDAHGLLLNVENGSVSENKAPSDAGLLSDLDLRESEGWVVGAQGSIYHTSNAGATWRKEISPTDNDLYSVFIMNAKRVWIAGDKLTVLGLNTD